MTIFKEGHTENTVKHGSIHAKESTNLLAAVNHTRVTGTLIGTKFALDFRNAEGKSSLGAVTRVPAALALTTLLAANTSRRQSIIHNDSNRDLYMKHGAGATITDFTDKLEPGDLFVNDNPTYTGIITGIWLGGGLTGAAQVTEHT